MNRLKYVFLACWNGINLKRLLKSKQREVHEPGEPQVHAFFSFVHSDF